MTKDEAMRLNEKVSDAYQILDDIAFELSTIQENAQSYTERKDIGLQIGNIEMAIENLPTFEGDE